MRTQLLLAALTLAVATSDADAQDFVKNDIHGGFLFSKTDLGLNKGDQLGKDFSSRTGFRGFQASYTRNFSPTAGLKFEFARQTDGQNFSFANNPLKLNKTLYQFHAGLQLKKNSTDASVRPFVHALGGVARASAKTDAAACATAFGTCPDTLNRTRTGLSFVLGGGLDVRLSDRVDLRAFQLDYNPMRLNGRINHSFRVGVGLVFH